MKPKRPGSLPPLNKHEGEEVDPTVVPEALTEAPVHNQPAGRAGGGITADHPVAELSVAVEEAQPVPIQGVDKDLDHFHGSVGTDKNGDPLVKPPEKGDRVAN